MTKTLIASTQNSSILKVGDMCCKVFSSIVYGDNTDMVFTNEFVTSAVFKELDDYTVGADRMLVMDKKLAYKIEQLTGYKVSRYAMLMEKAVTDLLHMNVTSDVLPDIVVQMVECLAMIHSIGVCHGDVKPANYLLTSDGDVKLADFGLCFPFTESQALYTEGYVPPEVTLSPTSCSPVTDVWALGASIYQMITGDDVPFPQEPIDASSTAKMFLEAYGYSSKQKKYFETNLGNDVYEVAGEVAKWSRKRLLYNGESLRDILESSLSEDNMFLADVCMSCLSPIPSDRPQNAVEVLLMIDPEADIDISEFIRISDSSIKLGETNSLVRKLPQIRRASDHSLILAELITKVIPFDSLDIHTQDHKGQMDKDQVYLLACLNISQVNFDGNFLTRDDLVDSMDADDLKLYDCCTLKVMNALLNPKSQFTRKIQDLLS